MNASGSAPQRRIVITGVSRGLGRALTESFVQLGHVVCGCARDSAALKSLQTALGTAASLSAVDVADDAAVRQWSTEVMSRIGTPDLLINNAAVINPNNRLWEITAEDFDRLFAINVSGTVNTLRHFLPAMVAANRGVIVNLSSGWGRYVSAEVAPYCASKWAIEGLTQALAEELPDRMCAVPLNPGIINTEMLQSCFASGAKLYPSPEDWARRAVPFILQLNARHNGEPLSVPE